MGEALCILKQAKEATAQSTRIQALAAKPPNLNIEMTPQQFRKFRIDWDVFTKMTNMPSSQFNIHLYNCADEAVQNAIINTHPNFFTTDPGEHDLSDIYIKDQIIRGVANDALQADLLAKAGTLKTLKQNVRHTEAFESALRDQTSKAGASDITSARLSTYCRQKGMPQTDKGGHPYQRPSQSRG